MAEVVISRVIDSPTAAGRPHRSAAVDTRFPRPRAARNRGAHWQPNPQDSALSRNQPPPPRSGPPRDAGRMCTLAGAPSSSSPAQRAVQPNPQHSRATGHMRCTPRPAGPQPGLGGEGRGPRPQHGESGGGPALSLLSWRPRLGGQAWPHLLGNTSLPWGLPPASPEHACPWKCTTWNLPEGTC